MIDELTIRRIKEAANVKDVIGDFYSLRKDGVSYTCLCPFHQDRHIGSFKVSESKNIYTCYSCGAHGGPVDFLMAHEKLSFIEAIRWLGAKYGIDVEGADEFRQRVKQCKPHAPVPPLPMLTMPTEWVKSRQIGAEENTLVKWVSSLNWDEEQRKRVPQMVKNYLIGHSAKEGHTIFWQIDELGNVHTGKMMLYKADGHRDKEARHNFDFIHSVMYKARMLDPMEREAVTCYFGQHLMKVCPGATVNIVESEKTALICAIYFGDLRNNVWVATGGLNFLNKQKLEPFIKDNRLICLYPDHDGLAAWKEKKNQIGYKHMRINTDIVRQFWRPEDGEKADIADILVRLISNKPTIEQMMDDNTMMRQLVDTFDLIETK